jgi:hypothetical protein
MTVRSFAGVSACTLGAFLLSMPAAQAAEGGEGGLDLSASVRMRYEAYDGTFRPTGAKADDALTFRTRLQAVYGGEGWRIGGEIRDTRGYLIDTETPISAADIDALQVPQLYVAAEVNERVEVTAGRFVMNLGSNRFVGDPAYRNTANGFTGVRLDWSDGGRNSITAFYTLPQRRTPEEKERVVRNAYEPDKESLALRFWGGLATHDFGGRLTGEAYAFVLNERDTVSLATRNRQLWTIGGRVELAAGPGFDGEVEAAWQGGHIRKSAAANAARVRVAASTIHAEMGYTFGGRLKPRVALHADTATGDKAGTDRYERFDALFGPRRFDWGPTEIYGPLARSNIRSAGVRFELKPSKRLDAMVDWRKVGLASATDAFANTRIKDGTGASGRDGGSQIDGRVRYWIVPKKIQIDLGASLLSKGRLLREAPNVQDTRDTRFAYCDLYYNF